MLNKMCFNLVFLYSITTVLEFPTPQLIVWNVGQGQWSTLVKEDQCWHFDFGGERNPIQNVKEICSWRQNALLLSHADRDHFSFIRSIKRQLKQICLMGPSWNRIDKSAIGAAKIENCPRSLSLNYHFYLPPPQHSRDDNIKSQVVYSKTWLIPGDAPQSSEKKWLVLRPPLHSISKLILGHHGSKTSTSNALLRELGQLRQCISSSRQKKYGHPHRDVRIRIHNHCSLILTEDWNHLHFIDSI